MNVDTLLQELVRDEGLRLTAYRCPAGKITVGVGRNLEDVGITEGEAMHLLRNDVARVQAELDRALPWWSSLDEVRQRVLVNMAFNMGTPTLLDFEKTLAAIRSGNFVGAANRMLESKWARQVGERAQRLARMMVTGGVE